MKVEDRIKRRISELDRIIYEISRANCLTDDLEDQKKELQNVLQWIKEEKEK